MRSEINPISQKVEITQVRDVEVTETVDDGEGGFLRSIKIKGEPVASSGPGQVLEIQLRSDTKSDLDITTPELSF